MVGCKCIICRLTEMVEKDIEQDIYDDILEHIEHCDNCLALYNTFVKTIDLCHDMDKIKLSKKKKKDFHQWIRVEAKRVVIKRYRW